MQSEISAADLRKSIGYSWAKENTGPEKCRDCKHVGRTVTKDAGWCNKVWIATSRGACCWFWEGR
jgi:hypothetical protein